MPDNFRANDAVRVQFRDFAKVMEQWITEQHVTGCPNCGADVTGAINRRRHWEWHQNEMLRGL